MHSREPDFIDARRLVDGYVRFGDAADSIPEYARPIIVSVVAEVLSLARKQEYSTVSDIAGLCARLLPDSSASAQIVQLCESRLDELSGLMNDETRVETVAGRAPAPKLPCDPQIGSRNATRRMNE